FVDRGVGDVRAPLAENERVAVGRGMRDAADADAAGRAGDVLDDERLAQRPAHMVAHDARQSVDRAAGRKGRDQGDRPRRIGVRPCEVSEDRQGGGARGQLQHIAARQFHETPLCRRASVRSDCHFYDFDALSARGLVGRAYQDAETGFPRQLIIWSRNPEPNKGGRGSSECGGLRPIRPRARILELSMDKKLAGLLGAVAGLATMGAAHAATQQDATITPLPQAASYAELLGPVSDAPTLLAAA